MPAPDVSGDWHGSPDPGIPGPPAGGVADPSSSRLADDYYLIANHGLSGRRLPDARVASVGVAACLIGELIFAQQALLSGTALRLLPDAPPPRDDLMAELVQLIRANPEESDLNIWLGYLARGAVEGVRDRLASLGVLVRSERRRLVTKQVVFEVADANAVVWPAVRLSGVFTRADPIVLYDGVLAGLLNATGLTGHLLWDPDLHQAGLGYLQHVLTLIPPPFTVLLERTEVAVGQVLLTKRA